MKKIIAMFVLLSFIPLQASANESLLHKSNIEEFIKHCDAASTAEDLNKLANCLAPNAKIIFDMLNKNGKYKQKVRYKDEFLERSKAFLSTGVDTEIIRKNIQVKIDSDSATVLSTATEIVKMPKWEHPDTISFEEKMTIVVIDGQLKASEIYSKQVISKK
ncbi:hypothetical protein [Spartinivicinus ruber]|uniref:hypothetical protein n=1 Tax=Spartinivicinus ruber TaxID=2683272 RepID=UPI0013D3C952|nr:hypothetical protein [Spartinivicinus ruber]